MPNQSKKLSVIIGAYRANQFIEECLDSISIAANNAEKADIQVEILLGIDGCHDTLYKVLELKDKYPNLKLYWLPVNQGVYITFNTLLKFASGSHVVFFGADDIMYPDMITKMFEIGAPLVIRHHGIQFLEMSIFKRTGGFMPWRISADTEHLSRVERIIGKKVPKTEYMYTYRSHPGQLTKLPETSLNSQLRANYVLLIKSGAIPTKIVAKIHPEIIDLNIQENIDKIPPAVVVGIASFPGREKSLSETIQSLINQVNKIYVHLNLYNSVPEFLNHPKIEVSLLPQDPDTLVYPDLGDIGKFYYVFKDKFPKNSYCFSADDDLIYHPDYVKTMIAGIEKYNRKAFITAHARIFINYPIKSYYRDEAVFYPCLRENKKDVNVHFGGTGVMAWHSSIKKLTPDVFDYINMADIFVSRFAHQNNIPLVCIKHPADFVRESRSFDRNNSICRTQSRNDSVQTSIVNAVFQQQTNIEAPANNQQQTTTAQPSRPSGVNNNGEALTSKASKQSLDASANNKQQTTNNRHCERSAVTERSRSEATSTIIISRLYYSDKDLLKARIKLCKEILVPCLKAQSSQDFLFAIRCYDEDAEMIKKQLGIDVITFSDYPQFLTYCKENNYHTQIRHDSDDYMSPDYIAFIQSEIAEKSLNHDKFLMQFQVTKMSYPAGKVLPMPDYTDTCNSGFLTLYQKEITHSIYERSHTEMHVIAPTVFTYPRGFVKYYIHGKNDSLLPREVRVKQVKF